MLKQKRELYENSLKNHIQKREQNYQEYISQPGSASVQDDISVSKKSIKSVPIKPVQYYKEQLQSKKPNFVQVYHKSQSLEPTENQIQNEQSPNDLIQFDEVSQELPNSRELIEFEQDDDQQQNEQHLEDEKSQEQEFKNNEPEVVNNELVDNNNVIQEEQPSCEVHLESDNLAEQPDQDSNVELPNDSQLPHYSQSGVQVLHSNEEELDYKSQMIGDYELQASSQSQPIEEERNSQRAENPFESSYNKSSLYNISSTDNLNFEFNKDQQQQIETHSKFEKTIAEIEEESQEMCSQLHSNQESSGIKAFNSTIQKGVDLVQSQFESDQIKEEDNQEQDETIQRDAELVQSQFEPDQSNLIKEAQEEENKEYEEDFEEPEPFNQTIQEEPDEQNNSNSFRGTMTSVQKKIQDELVLDMDEFGRSTMLKSLNRTRVNQLAELYVDYSVGMMLRMLGEELGKLGKVIGFVSSRNQRLQKACLMALIGNKDLQRRKHDNLILVRKRLHERNQNTQFRIISSLKEFSDRRNELFDNVLQQLNQYKVLKKTFLCKLLKKLVKADCEQLEVQHLYVKSQETNETLLQKCIVSLLEQSCEKGEEVEGHQVLVSFLFQETSEILLQIEGNSNDQEEKKSKIAQSQKIYRQNEEELLLLENQVICWDREEGK